MNKINITITGPTGSGKTILSETIKHALTGFGLNVSYTNPEPPINPLTCAQREAGIESFKDRYEIVIEEKQSPRPAVNL